MAHILPAWNGHVISACHRMGITRDALAKEMGVNRTYLSKILNKKRTTEYTRSLVEEALRSQAKRLGFNYDEDVLATESDFSRGLTN